MLEYLSGTESDMGARASFHAARMSLERLLGELPGDLLNPGQIKAERAYLWTFTTADVVDAGECLQRWRKFCKKFPQLVAFRVLEKHPKGHGWHIHFVSRDRYDVREVRQYSQRAGFGRIHVLALPPDRAAYVIKYLVKALRQQTGRRLWACVGYRGVTASDVLIEDTFWQEIFNWGAPSGYSLGAVRKHGLERLLSRLFHREPNEERATVKNEHIAQLQARAEKGEVVCLAEYRSTRVDQIKIASKSNPSQKVERVILRHGLEMGNSQATLVEWLPEGTSADLVKTTLKKGQLVLVSVKKMNFSNGLTEISGEVVPLS